MVIIPADKKPPPDAPAAPGGATAVPRDENRPDGTAHDPRDCRSCNGGVRRWTSAFRDEEWSRAACAGRQLEESLC